MTPTFTEDDIDKTVESAAGEELGTVVAFDPDTAYVEPVSGVTDSITAVLDWDGDGEGPVPVGSDAVRRITDEAVVLEDELPGESGEADGRDRTEDRTDGGARAEELASLEEEASRELEVDPTELTDRDPASDADRAEDDGNGTGTPLDDGGGTGTPPGDEDGGGPTTEDGVPPGAETEMDTGRRSGGDAGDERSESDERGREEDG